MQYNSMHLIPGNGPRQGVYVQQSLATQPRPPGVFIQQGYPGGYMTNYPPQQMVIQQQEMIREPSVGPVPAELVRAQNMQNMGPVLAASQTQQLMNPQPVFVPNGIHIQQMSMNGEEYMKSAGGAHIQPGQVRPPYIAQRNGQLQQLPNNGNNNSAQFVSTIQGIPLYSPDAQANQLHVLSPPQGHQYLIEHSPVQLAHPQQQFAAQSPHNMAQQQGGGSIYIVPNAENVSQRPPLISPVMDSLQHQQQQNDLSRFTAVTQAINSIQATGGGAGIMSPVQTLSHHIQSLPSAVVQTVGTITMVTCGDSLNTVVVSMPSGVASQPTIPGVANVNIVSASQRPVCSVNLVSEASLVSQTNVLPGIGSLMTAGAAVSEMEFPPPESVKPIKPQITLLKTETTVLSTASHNYGKEVKDSKHVNTVKSEGFVSKSGGVPFTETEVTSEASDSVVVPYGWRRELQDDVIIYYSPSGTALRSHEEVCVYITAENTCKCGLLCPLRVETCFNFDSMAQSRPWTLEDASSNKDLTKLCEHKRKIVTMATLQNSAQIQQQLDGSSGSVSGTLGFDEAETTRPEKTAKKGIKRKKKKVKPVGRDLQNTVQTSTIKTEDPLQVKEAIPLPNNSETLANLDQVSSPLQSTVVSSCTSSSNQQECSPVMLSNSSGTTPPTHPLNNPVSSSTSTTVAASPTLQFRPDQNCTGPEGGQFAQGGRVGGPVSPGCSMSMTSQGHIHIPDPRTFSQEDPNNTSSCSSSSNVNIPNPRFPMGSQNPHLLMSPERLFSSQPNSMGQVLYSLATQQGQKMSYVQSPPLPGLKSHHEHPAAAAMVSPPFYNPNINKDHPEFANFKWNVRDNNTIDKPKKKRARKTNKKASPRNNSSNTSLACGQAHFAEAIESVTRPSDGLISRPEKQGEPTFLDNPTAFMAQQTAIVNSSLPGTSPPHKPQASMLVDTSGGTTTMSSITQDSEIIKLLNAPTPKKGKAKSLASNCDMRRTINDRQMGGEVGSDGAKPELLQTSHDVRITSEKDFITNNKTDIVSSENPNAIRNAQISVDQMNNNPGNNPVESQKKKGKHKKPDPIDTSGACSLPDNSPLSLNSPPVAMSTPKMSVTMALGQIRSPASTGTEEEERGTGNAALSQSQGGVVAMKDHVTNQNIQNVPVSSPGAQMRGGSLQQPPPGVLHGRYRLGTPAASDQKTFLPASQMLSAAARAQTGSGNNTPIFSPPPPSAALPSNSSPPQQQAGRHHNLMSPPPPQGYPPFPHPQGQGHPMPQRMGVPGVPPMYRGPQQRFGAGPQMQQPVAPPGGGDWQQQQRMMFVERAMRPGMPAMQPGPNFSGPRGAQKSPIQMVQNMIYGLQASQNALAVAMQPEAIPNKRRRKSTSSEGSGRSSARPNSVNSSMEYGGQQMMYEGAQYQPFHPQNVAMDVVSQQGMYVTHGNNNTNIPHHHHNQQVAMQQQQAVRMLGPSEQQQHQLQHHQQMMMMHGNSGNNHGHPMPPIMPNMVVQAPPPEAQAPPTFVQQQQLANQHQMMVSSGSAVMETNNVLTGVNSVAVVLPPHLDPASLVRQQEEAVSEMLPSITTAMPNMSVAMVTGVTNAITDVISSPATLAPGQPYTGVEAMSVTDAQHTSIPTPGVDLGHVAVSENPVVTTKSPASKAKKQCKKKKKPVTGDTQPVLTGTIAKILESAKREIEAQKQQPPSSEQTDGRGGSKNNSTTKTTNVSTISSPCKQRSPPLATASSCKNVPEDGGDGRIGNYGESQSLSGLEQEVESELQEDQEMGKNCTRNSFYNQMASVATFESRPEEDNELKSMDQDFCVAENDDSLRENLAKTAVCDNNKTVFPPHLEEQEEDTLDSLNSLQENNDIPDESEDSQDHRFGSHDNGSHESVQSTHLNTPLYDNSNSPLSPSNHHHHDDHEDGDSNVSYSSHGYHHHVQQHNKSLDSPPTHSPANASQIMLSNLYAAGHIDLLSTSYAIRTPRMFTSAKARSAARILRKARKGAGLRKIKRSFPGQLGEVTEASPPSSSPDRRSGKKKSRCIDKNFNSCSPSDKDFEENMQEEEEEEDLSDDNDSATHSHSEMDTSRCSQSSDTSAHTEVNDPATDDSGINCELAVSGDGNKAKTIATKRGFQQTGGEEARPPRGKLVFSVGDVVWGESRGFPSWPGKLVHESDVKGHHYNGGSKRQAGKVWVRWFGNHTFAQVEPHALKTLSEGLEAHHRERQHFRKGRKLSLNLDDAIQEAMGELDRQTRPTHDPSTQSNTTSSTTNNNSSSGNSVNSTAISTTDSMPSQATGRVKLVKKKKR